MYELKNIIAAVALSIAIIVLYTLFFAPSPEEIKQNRIKQEQVQKDSDMPSVDQNENFFQAAKRELKEETGIKSVELIKEIDEWLEYDLPEDLINKLWNGKYRGQKQKWFIMKFIGNNDEINIETAIPEFSEWKWIEVSKLQNVAIYFKTHIYKKVEENLNSLKLN